MPLVLRDRVQVSATPVSTTSFTLGSAVVGYQTLATAGVANNDTVYYAATDSTNWEVGIGTYVSATPSLTRTTILSSSNGGAAVSTFDASVNVWIDYPASKAVYKDANNNVGIGIDPTGTDLLEIGAGTATVAPLGFTSGTNLTTPAAGSIEYDGKVLYFDHVASARGVVVAESFIATTATKTLANTTAVQSLFAGASGATNGALTVAASTSYYFECSISITSMSGTSGNMGFSIDGAGTATFTSAAWHSLGLDQTTLSTANNITGIFSSSETNAGNILSGASGTSAAVFIKGIFRINAAGTIIPSVALTNAVSTAVVGVNTWFKCYPIGTNTSIVVGNWS